MADFSSMRKREKPEMLLQDTKGRRSLTPRMRRRLRKERLKKQRVVVLVIAISFLLAILAGVLISQLNADTGETESATQEVSSLKQFPVKLDRTINTVLGQDNLQPSDIAVQDKVGYLVDLSANSLCSFDYNEKTLRKLSLSDHLDKPLAVDIYKGNVYIADSNAARIAVVSRGNVSSHAVPIGNTLAQPSGIKVLSNGDMLVPDPANHRVVQMRPDGGVTRIIGTGFKDDTNNGFNTPSGITVDIEDNIYVCDSLNSRVQKFSPEGRYLATYGKLGGVRTKLAQPTSVAVDGKGRIYVADSKRNLIFVFSQDDDFLGVVGKQLNEQDGSFTSFDEPAGIKVFEDRLFVADRKGEIHIFKLPPQFTD